MNLMFLPFLTLLTIGCAQETPKVYVTNQTQNPPPINDNCRLLRPLTWNCYQHQLCAALVCNVVYSDNSYRSICTANPAQDVLICN
jgi:hypothetical protein